MLLRKRLLIIVRIVGLSCLVFVCAAIFLKNFKGNHLFFNDSALVHNFKEFSSPPTPNPSLILLLSSMPRSGSTFIGELISNKSANSVFYFEPCQMLQGTDCEFDKDCVSDFTRDLFNCNPSDSFIDWLTNKRMHFFVYFNNELRQKCLNLTKSAHLRFCTKNFDPVKLCQETNVRMIKVIRYRLKWLESLIADPKLNLKVIHLVRDPRGSLRSITKFNWNLDMENRCEGQLNDIIAYEHLKKMYPHRVTQILYENVCMNPYDETKKLFKFLDGNEELSQNTINFLDSHVKKAEYKSKLGAMSTQKDSFKQIYEWRLKISEDLLTSIQNENSCQSVIHKMNLNMFKSLSDVRNISLSLFS